MTKPMTKQWMEVACAPESGASSMQAFVATPPEGKGPGVVLCPDAAGVTASLTAMAEDLALEGYVVLAPELGSAADGDDPKRAMAKMRSAVEALARHPAFIGQIGAVGFGVGGTVALLAAADGLVNCAVAYCPVALEKHVDTLRTLRVPVTVHFAGDDALTPQSTIRTVTAAISSISQSSVHVYAGMKHGFGIPGDADYASAQGGMARSRTVATLRKTLGPWYDLSALWEAHRACEFETRDAEATMATMVEQPYVNHIPTMVGGYGQIDLHRFYRDFFIPNNPADMRTIPISRTVGADRVVNEGICCFTHDREVAWMLPGVSPTGRYVEIALVGIITFRGNKLAHEHIYWDQASVLVQIGLLDPTGLPVGGRECARKVLDPSLPANKLLPQW